MDDLHWNDLIIERRTAPPAMSDEQFRAWMADRLIFVSSVMDAEMNPARDSARAWIRQWGGEPVMWEEITPQDRRPQDAYLDGVDRSDVFLLLLGTFYGVSDQTGFSPTHKEANRASDRGITRLLYQPEGIPSSAREGKLNNWVRSLYHEVSGGKYGDTKELTRKLEARVREIASGQETPWGKLGQLVFPGTVTRRNRHGTTELEVRATLREASIRRAMGEIGSWSGHVETDRLSWVADTLPVHEVEAEIQSSLSSQSQATLTARLADRSNTSRSAFAEVSMRLRDGRHLTPADQAEMWGRHAAFGDDLPDLPDEVEHSLLDLESLTLPAVLGVYEARGWLAEGLTRLYIVEGLVTRFGGGFEQLDVGPASSTSIRVKAMFRPSGFEQRAVRIEGLVPLT